jgi:hypothetical protein
VTQKHISFISIATRNFLPFVAVLAESLRRHQPDHRLICYLVEDRVLTSDSFDDLLDIIPIGELELPDGLNFIFQYTAFELCCALKPYVIMDQFMRFEADSVVYLDADMYLYSPLLAVLEKSWQNGSILLTPHLLSSSCRADFAVIGIAGAYNAGFIAARNNSETKEMLNWWQARCDHDCYMDVGGGINADQRWLDLAVGIFPCITIIRDPGINVGHWNIHERSFSQIEGQVMVNNQVPLCLFHFSGFIDPGLSKYLNERVLKGGIPGIVQKLASKYAKNLNEFQQKNNLMSEYSFARFSDQTPITPAMREIIRLGMAICKDPFSERKVITSVLPSENSDDVLKNRTDYLLKHYHSLEAQLLRLNRHFVIGRILRLWRLLINPNI